MEAVFSILTNVNFDPEWIRDYIEKTVELRESLKKEAKIQTDSSISNFKPAKSMEELIKQGEEREIEPSLLCYPDRLSPFSSLWR